MDAKRAPARALAAAALARGDATGWFEELYARASGTQDVPWADLAPNPSLLAWLEEHGVDGAGRRALKVGAGLGDDAEALAQRGFAVTAFDIAPSAVAWARRRFPDTEVDSVVADVLAPPPEWSARFDLVLEAYTLQVLPADLRAKAARRIADMVAPGGTLLVIARGRDEGDDPGAMPWPLTPDELRARFAMLDVVAFDDFLDDERPPVRRLVAEYRRPEPLAGRRPTSHERRTGLPWDASYRDGPAPWDTGRPQPAIMRLASDGAFAGTVLDAGCGTGENALHVASLGSPVVGVDVAETALAIARAKADERGIEVEFAAADALWLDRLGRSFETVLDCGLFHTFDGDERPAYVASLASVTEHGGTLYVLCFSDDGPDTGPHPISEQELRAAFAPSTGWRLAAIEPDRVQTRYHDHGAPAWLARIERI